MDDSGKSVGALRTIGELADEIGRPQHILRYWEKRFPQLKPMQRAGNRRYYRAEDVALVKRIDALLKTEGYTIEGAAKALRHSGRVEVSHEASAPAPAPAMFASTVTPDFGALREVRDRLARAVAEA